MFKVVVLIIFFQLKIFKKYLEEVDEGAGFSVVKNNKILINIFGKSKNLKEDWDNNTLVNTFSLSKGIYCGCLLKLIDQNEINLDKDIFLLEEFWKSNKKILL